MLPKEACLFNVNSTAQIHFDYLSSLFQIGYTAPNGPKEMQRKISISTLFKYICNDKKVDMEGLVYRDALPADLEQIVAIYNTTIASRLVTADTEEVSTESRLAWFEDHSADRRPLWIVENQAGDTIGWVSFQSFYGRPAYNGTVEVSIYLAADKRGAGYGKQILQHTLDTAPQFQIKTLLAFIFSHNIPSLNLFYRFGFTDWGDFPRIAEMDDQEYGLKILGKRLVP